MKHDRIPAEERGDNPSSNTLGSGSSILPPSSLPRPSSFRWRNIILGTLLVCIGLAAALITVLARRTDNYILAAAMATVSLLTAVLMLIFLVPPLARSARLEVKRFDLPVEVTSGGGIFIVVLLVVAFAAWNTGNNLLFLIFSLLCSTLFVAGVAARASLRDLIVSARFPDHIFAREGAPVIVTLRNAKRLLPSFSILVEARGPETVRPEEKSKRRAQFLKRQLAYFTYVPHHAAAEQRVEQSFEKRGHVLITGFELSTRFPFGFFRFRRRLRARDVDIVVYPKPEAMSDELHLLPAYSGRTASMRRGIGQDLFSLRAYKPHDDLRHIDWKATARSRNLTVREFTAEDERRITIVLDTRAQTEEGETSFTDRFESGVVQAASLLKHFITERAEVRLMLGQELGPYGSGLKHLYDCLRRLALVTPESNTGDTRIFSSTNENESGRGSDMFEEDYAIVLTTAPLGSIPARIWRTSHVIHV